MCYISPQPIPDSRISMHISTSLLFTAAVPHVTSTLYAGNFCSLACDLTLNYTTFNDTDPDLSQKVRSCRSKLRVTSVYLCLDEFCKDDIERENWIEVESRRCQENAGAALPLFHQVVDSWSPDQKAAVRRLRADEAMSWPILNEVVVPNGQFFDRAFTTMDVAFRQYNLHLVYGWYMYYFWIVVVTVGISSRLLNRIGSQAHESISGHKSTPPGVRSTPFGKPGTWLKRFITIPATFGNHCSRPLGWCTIPPRVQSLTIFAFVILNVYVCSCSYELTTGNLYWPKTSMQLLRYISDRTGIISLANFPLIWLFGMRNDVLIWMTGWGFGTYNAFHRWVARVATLQAVIHSVGYTVMILDSGGWTHFLTYWTSHYFWNGEVGTIAMCALLAFSFYGMRRAHYEIFLVTHIALSIASLWSMYYHVEIFTNGEWNIFIWPCLFIWVFDRILRIGRTLAFNRCFWNTRATVTYDPSSNLMRLIVDGTNNLRTPKPGTYYYIHVLNDIRYMHQSHPFTLAYPTSHQHRSVLVPLSPASSRPSAHRTDSSESSESDALLSRPKLSTPNDLVFLIRPYDGFTARLKRYCTTQPRRLRVLIEGPYGHSEALHLFPNVLFIVGGTGIAVALSHLDRLLSSESHAQSVKIVWAVREHAFFVSILGEFRGLLADERVEVEVHITQQRDVVDEVLYEDVKSVRVMTRRPDVSLVVEDAAQTAGQQGLAVVACGPALMADEARKASVEMLARGYRRVEYFEESFKW